MDQKRHGESKVNRRLSLAMKFHRRPQTVRAPIPCEHEGFAEARVRGLRDFTFRAWRFTVRISLFFRPFSHHAAHSVPRENLPIETNRVSQWSLT